MKTSIINCQSGLTMSANFENRVNIALNNVHPTSKIDIAELSILDISVGPGAKSYGKFLKSLNVIIDGKEFTFKKSVDSIYFDSFQDLEHGSANYSNELKRIVIDILEDYATEIHQTLANN